MSVHVNWGPAMVEVKREDAGEKWCFGCRKRLRHDFVISAPAEPSYYGPSARHDCSGCRRDRTCFPGTWVTWEFE